MQRGYNPNVKEQDIAYGFKMYNRKDQINIDGQKKIETKKEKAERDGILGNWIDKLVGKKIVTVTETKTDCILDAHTLKIMEIIEQEKSNLKQRQMQGLNKNAS